MFIRKYDSSTGMRNAVTAPYKRLVINFHWLICLICLVTITGCLSPIALNRAVIAYDDAVTDVVSQQLLINIVRAHHRQPIHFTGVSNIAATFTFQASAGAAPAAGDWPVHRYCRFWWEYGRESDD